MISRRQAKPMLSMRAWIQCACHKASCDPREPIVSMLFAEAEHLSNSRYKVMTFGFGRLTPQLGNRTMGDLINDALGERFQSLFLFRCQSTELSAHPGGFRGAHVF